MHNRIIGSAELTGRIKQVTIKQENIKQENIEQKNVEQENIEQENIKQENIEQKNVEQENIEQENIEQKNVKQKNIKQKNIKQKNIEECSGKRASAELQHPVCLFGPERYESRYPYPLIVWLHSCFSSERELESVMPELSLQNYVACAPRGTICCDDRNSTFRWGRSAASAAIAEELVFDAIETAQRQFTISSERVFLAGFGAGGSMAWRIALRYPQRFAGVINLCGSFPVECQSLSNIHAARQLPTLWMFGGESKVCGITQVCDSLPLLHSAKLPVEIRQYPCGDELLSNMLLDANGWMMEHVTNQAAANHSMAEDSFSRN